MIKTIIALIPFAIFCLLGANLYVEYLVDKQFDKIEEELFKEQKIERLKSLIEHYKALSNRSVIRVIADKRIKECEQELKELEDDTRN